MFEKMRLIEDNLHEFLNRKKLQLLKKGVDISKSLTKLLEEEFKRNTKRYEVFSNFNTTEPQEHNFENVEINKEIYISYQNEDLCFPRDTSQTDDFQIEIYDDVSIDSYETDHLCNNRVKDKGINVGTVNISNTDASEPAVPIKDQYDVAECVATINNLDKDIIHENQNHDKHTMDCREIYSDEERSLPYNGMIDETPHTKGTRTERFTPSDVDIPLQELTSDHKLSGKYIRIKQVVEKQRKGFLTIENKQSTILVKTKGHMEEERRMKYSLCSGGGSSSTAKLLSLFKKDNEGQVDACLSETTPNLKDIFIKNENVIRLKVIKEPNGNAQLNSEPQIFHLHETIHGIKDSKLQELSGDFETLVGILLPMDINTNSSYFDLRDCLQSEDDGKYSLMYIMFKKEDMELLMQKCSTATIPQESDHNQKRFRLVVVRAEDFEMALRQYQIENFQLTYSNYFPRNCRMFIGIPVLEGGFINKRDRKRVGKEDNDDSDEQ